MTDGEFMDRAIMDQLQIMDDVDVHIGNAVMTVNGEPVAARTLVMQVTHHTNNAKESQVVTMFGMDQETSAGVAGALLYAMFHAYGRDAMIGVIGRVKYVIDSGEDVSPPR